MTMPGRSCVALRLLMLTQVLSDGFRKFRQLRQARNNSRRTEGKTRPARIDSIRARIRDGQSAGCFSAARCCALSVMIFWMVSGSRGSFFVRELAAFSVVGEMDSVRDPEFF